MLRFVKPDILVVILRHNARGVMSDITGRQKLGGVFVSRVNLLTELPSKVTVTSTEALSRFILNVTQT